MACSCTAAEGRLKQLNSAPYVRSANWMHRGSYRLSHPLMWAGTENGWSAGTAAELDFVACPPINAMLQRDVESARKPCFWFFWGNNFQKISQIKIQLSAIITQTNWTGLHHPVKLLLFFFVKKQLSQISIENAPQNFLLFLIFALNIKEKLYSHLRHVWSLWHKEHKHSTIYEALIPLT